MWLVLAVPLSLALTVSLDRSTPEVPVQNDRGGQPLAACAVVDGPCSWGHTFGGAGDDRYEWSQGDGSPEIPRLSFWVCFWKTLCTSKKKNHMLMGKKTSGS